MLFKSLGGEYTAISDIEQLIHQVENNHQDQRAFRRNNSNQPLSEYIRNVHVFDKADSPCFAISTLENSALDPPENFLPKLLNVVLEKLFVVSRLV